MSSIKNRPIAATSSTVPKWPFCTVRATWAGNSSGQTAAAYRAQNGCCRREACPFNKRLIGRSTAASQFGLCSSR